MHTFFVFLIVLAALAQAQAQSVAEPTPEAVPTPTPPAALAIPSPAPTPDSSPTPTQTSDDVIPLPSDPGVSDAPIISEEELPNSATAPGADGTVPDEAFTDPNSVIPEDISANLPPAPSGPSAEEIERKTKILYQEVRIKVDKDPQVRSLLEAAKTATTFEDERAAYREYYRLLFKKMRKADKSLVERCDRMEKAYLLSLSQTRIEPTIPLNLPPTPTALAN